MSKLFFLTLFMAAATMLAATSCTNSNAGNTSHSEETAIIISQDNEKPVTGAEQIDAYLPHLKNKNVALAVNHTSMVGQTHLADTLIELGVNVKTIFSPEHGFRGTADAGELINNEKDAKTGLPVISLYGKNKKPSKEHLEGIDIVVFDLQDVGARFYTYISTMHYIMEACAELNKEVLILDRPNPNGHYVDGPVLQPEHKSFVGIHPIPVVHGLTVGELAMMINGEGWLANGVRPETKIITVKNYTHSTPYSLPIKPSPNLPNDLSIKLYPSLCFFEGTPISVGRGTDAPFQIAGAPNSAFGNFTFTPVSMEGAAKNPMFENKKCYGRDFRTEKVKEGLNLEYLIYFYNKSDNKEKFFNSFFEKLAGTSKLRKQITEGWSEEKIKESWKEELEDYKTIRKKYLLYPDFE
ncbi:DUF1343 domain-containing protein [Cytophagaceae bacterium ABcell3]|nr:DUF1343 domain-containing protein [Cytophagaceae bacterium ABcell3]